MHIMLWCLNSHAAFKTINTILSTWCNFECALLCCSLDGSEPLGLRGVGEGAESEELALCKGGNRQSSEMSESWQIYKHSSGEFCENTYWSNMWRFQNFTNGAGGVQCENAIWQVRGSELTSGIPAGKASQRHTGVLQEHVPANWCFEGKTETKKSTEDKKSIQIKKKLNNTSSLYN